MTINATQAERPFRLSTPLGADVLLCRRWEAEERVSSFDRLVVEAWSIDPALDPAKLLYQHAELAITLTNGGERIFGGIIRRFVRGGSVASGFTAYILEIVPPHWALTLGTGFALVQEKTTKEILADTLAGPPLRQELQAAYKPRPYCFRYRESRWAFAARLMEQEGIWHTFEHAKGNVTLVQSDSMAAAKPAWGLKTMEAVTASEPLEERLIGVRVEWQMHVGLTALQTAVNMLPKLPFTEEKAIASGKEVWKAPAALRSFDFEQQLEAHHTGITHGGAESASRLQEHFTDLARYARVRQERAETEARKATGSSTCRGLTAGAKVTLTDTAEQSADGDWFVVAVTHKGSNGSYLGDETTPEEISYENTFELSPIGAVWRPPRTTPWPRVGGTHTGVVVGPKGEEIFTDKYGRVQVVMHWEEDAPDQKVACWMRVAQSWAGPQFGAVFLPRIGHEVLVAFLDGNPDNPVVVGSLYNGANATPWVLPDHKTQSGVRSRSTLKGTPDTYNEIRFEDKKDGEIFFVQAQKDMQTLVKNDETRTVGHDRTTTVKNDETRTVEEGNDTHTVKKGKQTITVEDNERELTVAKNQTVSIGENHSVTVGKSQDITVAKNQTVSVGDNETYEVGKSQDLSVGQDRKVSVGMSDELTVSQKITVKANMSIEFKCGGSSIKIDPSGITLKGPMIKIEAQAMLQMKGGAMAKLEGPMVQVQGQGMLMLKGGVTMIN